MDIKYSENKELFKSHLAMFISFQFNVIRLQAAISLVLSNYNN